MAAFLDFWRPSWIDNGEFLTLYSIHDNDHLFVPMLVVLGIQKNMGTSGQKIFH